MKMPVILTIFAMLLLLSMASPLYAQNGEKAIVIVEEIRAPISEVWEAWTTEKGAKTFFAPSCKINLVPSGEYEMYFMPGAPAGQKGGEGCRILAIEPEKMLSFTWSAPPQFPKIRKQYTTVILRFEKLTDDRTTVSFTQIGWGESEEWQKVYHYFQNAWGKVVFPRLKQRFAKGPIDWSNLPEVK
jgi:uncharacterized protein YndB with AHSA1/START domain